MTTANDGNDRDLLRILVKMLSAAGSALPGLLTGDPTALIAGATLNPAIESALTKTLTDLDGRLRSRREAKREVTAAILAVREIQRQLEAGRPVRDDVFFADIERNEATEVAEGALLTARRCHEENKVLMVSSLLAGICFDASVSAADANHFLEIADTLTYRQHLLLALFRRTHIRDSLREPNYKDERGLSIATQVVLQEVYDLYSRGLVCLPQDGKPYDSWALLGHTDVEPRKMRPTEIGGVYAGLADVDGVPDHELATIATLLS